jgi:hypothetical protein
MSGVLFRRKMMVAVSVPLMIVGVRAKKKD